MRVYIEIPDHLIKKLRDQAQEAHRPPRYQLEWLVMRALQAEVPRTDASEASTKETIQASLQRVDQLQKEDVSILPPLANSIYHSMLEARSLAKTKENSEEDIARMLRVCLTLALDKYEEQFVSIGFYCKG